MELGAASRCVPSLILILTLILTLIITLIVTYSVGSLGASILVPYYLPVITTLMLLVRSYQLNQRNKR